MATPSKEPRKHSGSCHCGAVRFEVDVDASSGGACNCSVCTKVGGDYVSVSLNALDDVDPADVKVGYWDGRHNNWEDGQRDRPWPIFA